MKTLIISPWSKKLRSGQENAKNYPYWEQVLLAMGDVRTVQIGTNGEKLLPCSEKRLSWPLKEIENLIRTCDAWVSVDNFLPHLAHHIGKRGVVLFSVSDPKIYGYEENINLLGDKKYLRPDQFRWWEDCPFNPDAFVAPETAIASIRSLLHL